MPAFWAPISWTFGSNILDLTSCATFFSEIMLVTAVMVVSVRWGSELKLSGAAVGPDPGVHLSPHVVGAGFGANADDVDHVLMAVRWILVVGETQNIFLRAAALGSTELLFVRSRRRYRGR